MRGNIDNWLDERNDVETYRVAGQISFLEAATALQRIVECATSGATRNTLVLFADTDAFLSCTRLKPLVDLVKAWKRFRGRARTALVLPTQSACVMTEFYLREIDVGPEEIQCFISEVAAQDWLDR